MKLNNDQLDLKPIVTRSPPCITITKHVKAMWPGHRDSAKEGGGHRTRRR
jgi:hypothetical protein